MHGTWESRPESSKEGAVQEDIDRAFAWCGRIYGGFYPGCWDEADVNNDNSVDVSDIIYLASYLLYGGPPPPACD